MPLSAGVAWPVHEASSPHGAAAAAVEVHSNPCLLHHGTRAANILRWGEVHAGMAGREAEEDAVVVGHNHPAYRLLGGFVCTARDYRHDRTSIAVDALPTPSLCDGVAMNWSVELTWS